VAVHTKVEIDIPKVGSTKNLRVEKTKDEVKGMKVWATSRQFYRTIGAWAIKEYFGGILAFV
jgi:hypothetical protein